MSMTFSGRPGLGRTTSRIASLILSAATSTAAAIDDGNRDHAFGAPLGFALYSYYDNNDDVSDVVVMSDGSLVMAGQTVDVANTLGQGMVVRLHPDGNLDHGFGDDLGSTRFTIENVSTRINAVARDSDDRIIVTGTSFGVVDDEFVWTGFVGRLNADGRFDASFGTEGLFTLAGHEFGDVAVHDSGRIVVAGLKVRAVPSDGTDMLALALDPATGAVDTSFGSGGFAIMNFGTGSGSSDTSDDTAYRIAIAPDGDIVLAGFTNVGGPGRMAIVKLTASGAPNTSFGESGKRTVGFKWCPATEGDDDATAIAVAMIPTKIGFHIALGGWSSNPVCPMGIGQKKDVLAMLTSSGELDASFGDGGRMIGNLFSTSLNTTSLRDVIWDPAGHLLLTGTGMQAGRQHLGVTQLLANGDFDPIFAGDGTGHYDLRSPEGFAMARALAIQGGRPIVVATWHAELDGEYLGSDMIAIRLVSDRIFGDGHQSM